MKLEEVVNRAVEAALGGGAEAVEAFAEDSTTREVRVFGGEVESLTDAGVRGAGIRAWIGGQVGYAYGTDLSDEGLRRLGADAAEAARIADPDQFAAPPEANGAGPAPDIPGLADASVAEWTTERKVELAKEVEARAREADERIEAVETAVYVDEAARVALASSTGLRQTGLGFGIGRGPADLDAAKIGREAADRATSLLGATKPGSRTCPVILDETVAASFFGFIGGLLCADAVQRGRSPFAGRLGEAIAADALTLADDGTDPAGLATAPIDGEGAPRRRTALIEAGKLAAYLHDSYTARREGDGTRSTASAARSGYRSPPSVSTSNLIVQPGTSSLADLLAAAEGGVYVTDVAGLHSGVNPVSGTFSVGATGRLISGGELADPADEFTIASDLPGMLTAVAATGADARWVPFGGSVRTPPVLIGEMAVGGA